LRALALLGYFALKRFDPYGPFLTIFTTTNKCISSPTFLWNVLAHYFLENWKYNFGSSFKGLTLIRVPRAFRNHRIHRTHRTHRHSNNRNTSLVKKLILKLHICVDAKESSTSVGIEEKDDFFCCHRYLGESPSLSLFWRDFTDVTNRKKPLLLQ
jgi:hypothetical protein